MQVAHSFKGKSLKIEEGSPDFLLTNHQGGYFLSRASKYRGFHVREMHGESWSLFKTVDALHTNKTPLTLTNRFCSVEKHTNGCSEKVFLYKNCLQCIFSYKAVVTVTLDMRYIHEFSTRGRIYHIERLSDIFLIIYTKYTDDTMQKISYTRYLGVKAEGDLKPICRWREQHYSEDRERGAMPDTLWVFDAFTFAGSGPLIICYGKSKEQVIKEANDIFRRAKDLEQEARLDFENNHHLITHCPKRVSFALLGAKSSLEQLTIGKNTRGIYAGLPWFFQFWARDESISLGAMLKMKRYHLAKHILMRYFSAIEHGRVANTPYHISIGSADGIGWVCKRMYELLLILEKKKILHYFFKKRELLFLEFSLDKAIQEQIKHRGKQGLIENGPLETWMDTSSQNNTREGIRIEIQALFLSMLKFSIYLKRLLKKDFSGAQDHLLRMQKVAHTAFFDGARLKDGLHDSTQRPNSFLAAYIYPDLLIKKEWKRAFDYTLDRLWLEWGGLSTVEKSSPLFQPRYTGMDNRSYHHGDSWFFINNLAAISMHRINYSHFKKYIYKILQASTEEILAKGLIGHAAELSSAETLEPHGCLAQAWSAATYIELVEELF